MATKTIAQQLRVAWEDSGLTLEILLLECRRRAPEIFDFDFTSLSRKLSGKQIMTTSEAEVLARVLDARISSGPARERSAS